ncbi:hypothetical protein niasHT_028874 [Heterodera trifolii]|uniref:RING-type domain-containing protein n=1 Tax=Heterodera trifolii TaxID=157864 RepID=A0ABD2JMU6_9BILA
MGSPQTPFEAAVQPGGDSRSLFRWGAPEDGCKIPSKLFYPNKFGMCLCSIDEASFFGSCGHVGLCRSCLLYHLQNSPKPSQCPYCKALTNYYMQH